MRTHRTQNEETLQKEKKEGKNIYVFNTLIQK